MQRTLEELVDFDLVNRCRPRLTVGAAHVRTSQMRYFDSRDCALSVSHVLASGALPPAFPAVRIGGELYWDGGVLSNTPTEPVFDNPRKDSQIFSVHLWNPTGAEPTTMAEVFNRHKDVQYSSRIATQIARQQQIHRLRHVINELAARLPEPERNSQAVHQLASYGCQTKIRRPPARAAARSRDPHQGRRFQPGRHHAALVGCGLRTHQACARARPMGRRLRSALRHYPARAGGVDSASCGVMNRRSAIRRC
jgi:NTE family protein